MLANQGKRCANLFGEIPHRYLKPFSNLVWAVNSIVSGLILVLPNELSHSVVHVELQETEALPFHRLVSFRYLGKQDLADLRGGELELLEAGCRLFGLLGRGYAYHVVQVRHHILAQSEALIEILLVEVTGLPSEGVEDETVLLLGDLDTWDPGALTFGELDGLLRVAAVIQPELYLVLVEIEAHSHCARGRGLETGQMLSLGDRVVDSELY